VVTCGIFEIERERELKSEEGGCVAVIFFSFQSGLLPRIGDILEAICQYISHPAIWIFF
jgi:hypothetical protein